MTRSPLPADDASRATQPATSAGWARSSSPANARASRVSDSRSTSRTLSPIHASSIIAAGTSTATTTPRKAKSSRC
ncbi:MAG: hypothetical protein LC659_14510 [Myxococcales bacterium]|nr:hypothetical protein [Myxococcales bacterium]